jgi:hypothetical protein
MGEINIVEAVLMKLLCSETTDLPTVSSLASYSAGSGFKFRPLDRLSCLRGFVVFLTSSREMPE